MPQGYQLGDHPREGFHHDAAKDERSEEVIPSACKPYTHALLESYPFTAPSVRPRTMYRWNSSARMTGMIEAKTPVEASWV